MPDELKKFIDEQFEALRKDISKAFEVARLRMKTAEEVAKLDKQQEPIEGAKYPSES